MPASSEDKTIIERDRAWRDAIVRGWKAEEELWKELQPAVTRVLQEKFRSNPLLKRMVPAAVDKAMEKLLAGAEGRKIAAWKAESPLAAYLTTIAYQQVLEWNKSGVKRGPLTSGDMGEGEFEKLEADHADAKNASASEEVSELTLSILCRFADAIRALGESKPRHAVILALQQRDAQQGDAGDLFGIHKTQVSADLKKINQGLMHDFGGEAGLVALAQVAEPFPEVWCGRHPGEKSSHPPLTDEDREALLTLCESPGDKTAMVAWQMRLLEDEATQDWVAECLKAVRRHEPPAERDAVLAGQRGRLKRAVTGTVAWYRPDDLAALLGSREAILHGSVLAKTGADAGTLWLLDDAARSLKAVFNPTEPTMIGQLQSLRTGIVSWCFKNEQTIRVARSADAGDLGPQHSTAIDQILGKTTHAMVAVPFYCAGEKRGVISLVKLTAGACAFHEGDAAACEALCEVLAQTMESVITKRILE